LKEEKTKQEAREAQKYEEYQKARGKLEDLRAQRSYLQKLRGQTLQQEMEDLSEDLDQLAPPEREAFEKLQSIHQKLTSKREQLAASELKIDFAAERDLTGSLCVDGDCEEISPQQGETLDLHAVKSLRLELDGIGTLRVETAMEQALQTKDDLEEYQRELEKGLQRHEASSWEELKDRYQKGEKLRAELKNLKNLYETVETEGSEKAQAQEEPERQLDQEFIRRFRSASRKELQLSMEQKGESVDRTVENVNQLREDWENRKEEREKINRAIQEKESKLQGQLQRKDEQLKQLKKIKEEIQEMDGQLEQTTIRSPGPEDMLDREAEKSGALYRNLKALWRNARDKKEGLEDQLERQKPDGEEVTEKTLETLESQTERLNEEEAELEKEMHALQGEIGRTADGLHAEIRDREEQIEQQKRILESARKETRSYELLRLALQEAKNETSREFLGPIKDKVAPRIREMTANRYREVNFDSNLKPESTVSKRREVRGKDQDLSYGTREQIIFLTRLAMAEVVSQNGRIPVIFDDSLVNADQERMKHARRYLQEAARSCQIIVFTCHPNSYPKGEGPGKRIFLEPLP
ncbi:MAG: ATP-binding protein, partial [Candidatus Acetothermia bacterium]